METRAEDNLNVLLATGLYPPDIGGPATYTKMLEEELPKHGISLRVVPFGTVRQYPKVVRHVVYAWRLWRHAGRTDLIYALDSISVGLPALLVSKLRRQPFLIRLGGDYAWEQGQQRFGVTATLDEYTNKPQAAPLQVRVLAWLQRLVVRRADRVIVPSEYLKSIVLTWGVREDHIEVVYSVLHPLVVNDSKASLREQLQYDGFTITSAGRLVPWKGFSELLQVIARVKEEIPEVTLIIIGDGPERARLEAQVAALGLNEQVRFPGALSKDALGAAIAASDVFVLNTAYEGLSHQLLEVMDLGVPIITTSVGGNPELIKSEVSGILTEVNDIEALTGAVLRLHRQPEIKERLIQHARVRTKDFDRTLVTQKIISIIKANACE